MEKAQDRTHRDVQTENDNIINYEVPQLVELGNFDDLTRGVGFPLADFFIHFD